MRWDRVGGNIVLVLFLEETRRGSDAEVRGLPTFGIGQGNFETFLFWWVFAPGFAVGFLTCLVVPPSVSCQNRG